MLKGGKKRRRVDEKAGLGLAELVQDGVDLCEGLVDLFAELR
jgi:hypothetical protein